MKKKTKLIGTISALAMSMAMLAGGVLAASQVNLNVSSTVSFEAQGVYLKVQGQVKRGTESGTSNLNESERPETEQGDETLSYSYLDYSYEEDTDGTPLGESSFENMPEWKIGTILFTESENVIQYEMVFTNYSEFDVSVNITPNKDLSLTNVAVEENSNVLKLNKNGGTATYTYTLKLNDVSSSILGDVSFNVEATKYEIIYAPITSVETYLAFDLTINGTDSYNINTINNLESLKEGDTVYLTGSTQGCSITLYNSLNEKVNYWGSSQIASDPISFTVPKLEKGYYFTIFFQSHMGGSIG